jgi:hypothetical protein
MTIKSLISLKRNIQKEISKRNISEKMKTQKKYLENILHKTLKILNNFYYLTFFQKKYNNIKNIQTNDSLYVLLLKWSDISIQNIVYYI